MLDELPASHRSGQITALRIMAMNHAELAAWQRVLAGDMLSAANEAAVQKFLGEYCSRILKYLPEHQVMRKHTQRTALL
jgi:hypothetical protein